MTYRRQIYLDNAATTALDPAIAGEMSRIATEVYGNASSRHSLGLEAERLIRRARGQVADAVGALAEEVTFTSGATEALAIALLGTAAKQSKPGHVLLSALEHPAVRNTAKLLERSGHTVEVVPVNAEDARLDLDALAKMVRKETFLLALMHVNNELGTIQPVARAARAVKRVARRCVVVCDVVQSLGLLRVDLAELGVDMLAASAHKLHGPKGVGCLVVRGRRPAPLWGGGDQEGGLRCGSENVPGIVGFGMACQQGKGKAPQLRSWTRQLASSLQEGLDAEALYDTANRSPNIIALRIHGLRAEVAVNALDREGIYISSGSACHGRRSLKSAVLAAVGLPDADDVIRLSLGRFNTEADVSAACNSMPPILEALRSERKPL